MSDARDRATGALVGLAVGDAVGTTLEFKAPGSFTPITDMVGGGPFQLPVAVLLDEEREPLGNRPARRQVSRVDRGERHRYPSVGTDPLEVTCQRKVGWPVGQEHTLTHHATWNSEI